MIKFQETWFAVPVPRITPDLSLGVSTLRVSELKHNFAQYEIESVIFTRVANGRQAPK